MKDKKEKIEIVETGMDVFNSLVNDQFSYGGSKYAGDSAKPQREATDDLVDDFTYLWLVGTFAKYAKRFKNVARERDLLKIACYMFITWLKRGYHLSPQGMDEIIDTNVKTKTEYYPTFLGAVEAYGKDIQVSNNIDNIYAKFNEIVSKYLYTDAFTISIEKGTTIKQIIQRGFNKITEEDLIYIYKTCYVIWNERFKDKAGEDADTFNETKNK